MYNSPEEILNDKRLRTKEKLKLLKSWELDQRALLEAGNENMLPVNGAEADPNRLLQDIQKAEHELEKRIEEKHGKSSLAQGQISGRQTTGSEISEE
jgi:hypothetical protein